MINAKHDDGREGQFSQTSWDKMNKTGWTRVVDKPADLNPAMEKAADKKADKKSRGKKPANANVKMTAETASVNRENETNTDDEN